MTEQRINIPARQLRMAMEALAIVHASRSNNAAATIALTVGFVAKWPIGEHCAALHEFADMVQVVEGR